MQKGIFCLLLCDEQEHSGHRLTSSLREIQLCVDAEVCLVDKFFSYNITSDFT
jgi:hypothetical protein